MSESFQTLLISGWADDGSGLADLADRLGKDQPQACLSLTDLEATTTNLPGLSPMAAALAEKVAESAQPVELIGWSTGAILALEVAKMFPEKVSRLVMLSGTPKFCADETWQAGVPTANVRAMMVGVVKTTQSTLTGFFKLAARPHRLDPQQLADRRDMALAQGVKRLAQQLRYLMQCDLREGLADVRVPTLLIHGKKDAVVPWQAAEWLAHTLPDARLEILAEAGHGLPVAWTRKVADHICGFRNKGRAQ